jgi:hypothetical protein
VFFWAVKTEFLKSEFKRLRSTKSVNALWNGLSKMDQAK